MSNFQSYKNITDRLKALGDKLSNEKLSSEELEEFETLSRQLFERALILNYKAKEAKVHGEETVLKKNGSEEPTKVDVKKEDKEEADTGEIQFDFSDDIGDVSEVKDNLEEEVEVTQQKNEESPIKESTDKVISENQEVVNKEVASEETINDNFDSDTEQSFYERFQKVHNESLGDRLGASKLSTLKNAIGLNDKMQFISELFDGDSEAFNKSIDALDQQPSNEDARKTFTPPPAKHSWDEENPLVEEFARLIERRYVEE